MTKILKWMEMDRDHIRLGHSCSSPYSGHRKGKLTTGKIVPAGALDIFFPASHCSEPDSKYNYRASRLIAIWIDARTKVCSVCAVDSWRSSGPHEVIWLSGEVNGMIV
jgi:hypothetical protein